MKFTGGSRCGRNYWSSFNATWPFATLTIEDDNLVLSTLFSKTYQFKKSQISQLTAFRGFFVSPGIRIEHTVIDYPPYIAFWTFSPRRVKAELIKNAFPIS